MEYFSTSSFFHTPIFLLSSPHAPPNPESYQERERK
uniref:Uncharacterized protein n=1 Tax=Nelumbo nucifera TaxID=4432 RepID=A0A822YM98_NELNU|nr:TPA_asm: hypothetical protein HUJ06_012493 [Nelumbo nucifera]